MATHNVRDDQLPAGAGSGRGDTPIIPAASVIVLRGEAVEVLMMRRSDKSTFVPGSWVFPGGVVEVEDKRADETATFRACAVRELQEEAGIQVAEGDLVLTARWVTPEGVPKRFDTCFFLARVESRVEARAADGEAAELRWVNVAQALAESAKGTMAMVFPTIKNLEAIAGFATAAELLAARRGASISTTRPVLVIEGGQKKIKLP